MWAVYSFLFSATLICNILARPYKFHEYNNLPAQSYQEYVSEYNDLGFPEEDGQAEIMLQNPVYKRLYEKRPWNREFQEALKQAYLENQHYDVFKRLYE